MKNAILDCRSWRRPLEMRSQAQYALLQQGRVSRALGIVLSGSDVEKLLATLQ